MFIKIIEKLNEGGAFFTYPMVFILILTIVYFIKALKNRERLNIISRLIANYGWFVFAWGGMGSAFGLIIAFDSLKTKTLAELTAQQLAGGFRMVILCSLLSALVFSICRLFIVILNTMESAKKLE